MLIQCWLILCMCSFFDWIKRLLIWDIWNHEFCFSGEQRRNRERDPRVYPWEAHCSMFLWIFVLFFAMCDVFLQFQHDFICFSILLLWFQRWHPGARPVNSNSLTFLVAGIALVSPMFWWKELAFYLKECPLTDNIMCIVSLAVLLLFMILNSNQMSPNFLVFHYIFAWFFWYWLEMCVHHIMIVSL